MRRFADALSAAGLHGARILDAGGTRAYWEEWAHFRLPFFAWWPLPLRAFFNWRFRLGVMPRHRSWPEAVAFCRSTRLLTRRAFARLFPSCSLWTERVLLLPKCYVVSDLEGAPS